MTIKSTQDFSAAQNHLTDLGPSKQPPLGFRRFFVFNIRKYSLSVLFNLTLYLYLSVEEKTILLPLY